jgi:hypothetical protein
MDEDLRREIHRENKMDAEMEESLLRNEDGEEQACDERKYLI